MARASRRTICSRVMLSTIHRIALRQAGRVTLPCHIAARTRIGAMQRLGQNAYAVWDLYAARSTGYVRPFLQLTNLTNTDYQEITGVVMPNRMALGGVEIAWPGKIR